MENKIQELTQRYQELQEFVKNIDQEKSKAVTEMVKIEGAVEVLRGMASAEDTEDNEE